MFDLSVTLLQRDSVMNFDTLAQMHESPVD